MTRYIAIIITLAMILGVGYGITHGDYGGVGLIAFVAFIGAVLWYKKSHS